MSDKPTSFQLTDYHSVIDFLYTQLPMFQRVGAAAYKKDLSNTIELCKRLGNPERKFKSVHVAGTNGKGSCSHYLAAVLQSAGYKTGLYTSPHLKNFTERIKINGQEISERAVTDFVKSHQKLIVEVKPSFFEITVAMAFDYFVKQKVDIAIVEVGMGGRLDSTNVITPEVSLITNISLDHQQWLGDSVQLIAKEKAGIIKPGVPLVISEHQPTVDEVFFAKAVDQNTTIDFGEDHYKCRIEDKLIFIETDNEQILRIDTQETVAGYQTKNLPAVFTVIDHLRDRDFDISEEAVEHGIANMKRLTGLKGRWQKLANDPETVCDVGHNEAGVSLIVNQLQKETFNELYIIWGSVNDKDISSVLSLLPREAHYYFCQANIPRAMPAQELYAKAAALNIQGQVIENVNDALKEVRKLASAEDLIFIGGSTFVVAELEIL